MGTLDGRVAVVTGAGRGVGRSEAMLLAMEGAAVVVNDFGGTSDGTGQDNSAAKQVADEIVGLGGTAIANGDDVADWDGGQRMIQAALEAFGQLDIVVCNAGILRDRTVFNMSEAEWDDVSRVHLRGHFVPTRFATAHWRQVAKTTGRPANGRLIFTASEAGIYGNTGQLNYVGAKGGIAAMGLAVAREMARYGVTCNTICPRARTRLTENIFGAAQAQEDEWSPENIAPLVGYLCSDQADEVSGQTFVVGGGVVELLEGWRAVEQVQSKEQWTLGTLTTAMTDLFGERSRATPQLPSQFDLAQP